MKYACLFASASIQKEFEKALLKIPHLNLREDIRKSVEQLAENPRPFGTKSFKQLNPPIEFYSYVAKYRVRIGDYRVVYDVDDTKKAVWIIALRKRNEATYR